MKTAVVTDLSSNFIATEIINWQGLVYLMVHFSSFWVKPFSRVVGCLTPKVNEVTHGP